MRPVCLRDDDVRAVLAGRKRQHRVPIKPQPGPGTGGYWCCISSTERSRRGLWTPRQFSKWPMDGTDNRSTGESVRCPYGQPGDVLRIKEAWQMSGLGWMSDTPAGKTHYRATDNGQWKSYWGKWRSPAVMPLRLVRLKVLLTSVRVERLQDISEADASAEGDPKQDLIASENTHRDWFVAQWIHHHGQKSWDANPWVWVLEWEPIKEQA